MIGVVFTVVLDLAGYKVGKNCRRGKNKVDFALTAHFIICDCIRFEEKMKFILLNNS